MPITRREFVRGGLAAAALSGVPDAARAAVGPGPLYDLCIVGSGFAGTTLGLRAVEAGLRCAIVEAGQQDFTKRPRGFFYDPSASSYPFHRTRIIGVGGSSNHWGGIVNRIRPGELRLRSRYGADVDWPLAYADLEPYYCRAEERLGVRGHAPVEGIEARRCAYPEPLEGPYVPPRVVLGEVPLHFVPLAHAFRRFAPIRLVDREIPQFEASPHGTLLRERQVTRVVTLDGKRIDHVVLRAPDGAVETLRARVFVVAAGTVETPRLLLLSRSKWFPGGLGNASGAVGGYLVEHPTYDWSALRPDDLGQPSTGGHRSFDFVDPFRRRGLGSFHFNLQLRRRKRLRWQIQPAMEPRLGNRVALGATRDVFGDPVPQVDVALSERDAHTVEAAFALLAERAEARGVPGPDAGQTNRWRSHPSGTCRMASEPGAGVVDPDGRVFGLENLYLAGACVFPTSGTANPTLTVVALALRLGDHLVARLRAAA